MFNVKEKNMETRLVNVYRFSELSENIQESIIEQYYINRSNFILDDVDLSLHNQLISELKDNNIHYENEKVLFSLGHSQDDGVCFTGNFTYNNINFEIKHNHYHYHNYSTNFYIQEDNEYIAINIDAECLDLLNIYYKICDKLEKLGYEILETRMLPEEYSEMSDNNNYYYFKNGQLFV